MPSQRKLFNWQQLNVDKHPQASQASIGTFCHIEQSNGLRFGEVGGHISLCQNSGKLSANHAYVFLAVWQGASSC